MPRSCAANFYKLLSVVGIIVFRALLGLMVLANNFVPLVFGEVEQYCIDTAIALCVVGLLRVRSATRWFAALAKARVDISFKFNVFKNVSVYPGILIGGHWRGRLA